MSYLQAPVDIGIELASERYTSRSRILQHEPIETRDQTAVKEERTDLYVVRT